MNLFCHFMLTAAIFPKANYTGLHLRRDARLFPFPPHAEGFKKRTKPDKIRFLNIAQGSLEECRYYLILAQDLGYDENKNLTELLEEISKLLESYMAAMLHAGS